jgi:hypothetical protein
MNEVQTQEVPKRIEDRLHPSRPSESGAVRGGVSHPVGVVPTWCGSSGIGDPVSYIVAWTGGFDGPSFKLEKTKEDAYATYDKWVDLAKDSEEGDWIHILQIHNDQLEVIEFS